MRYEIVPIDRLIPLEKVFGYINSFVEHQLKKVVVIANDNEIESGLPPKQSDHGSKYHRIKEKVIGKTFKVETEIPTVITSLIEGTAKDSTKFLLEKKDLLIEIFETVKEKTEKKEANYRAFSHVIRDFEYLWKKFDDKYKKHVEMMTDFIGIFMRIGYELQLGLIRDQDVGKIEGLRIARIFSKMSGDTEKEEYKAIQAFL